MWMNWVMDWATSFARFLLNNHMGRTQRFATNATLSSGRKLALSHRARPTARFPKVDRCDIFAKPMDSTQYRVRVLLHVDSGDSGFLPRQIAHSMRSSLLPHLRALCC